MKNISYQELVNCQEYAERIVSLYEKAWHEEFPHDINFAELAVREYNKELKSFKRLYGYSIRGYIPVIVQCIGAIIES
jgi:hypothetical protein